MAGIKRKQKKNYIYKYKMTFFPYFFFLKKKYKNSMNDHLIFGNKNEGVGICVWKKVEFCVNG